jgi:hypothetical protein
MGAPAKWPGVAKQGSEPIAQLERIGMQVGIDLLDHTKPHFQSP